MLYFVVSQLTGIYYTDLMGQPPLSVVLNDFLKWIDVTTKEHVEKTGRDCFPGILFMYPLNNLSSGIVLVAHNGYKYDFPLLFAEVDRRKQHLDTSVFRTHNIHFADTLILLQKVSR